MTYVYNLLILFAVFVLTALGVYEWMPEYRVYLMKEDSLIENLSALLFFSAFIAGLVFFLKIKKNRWILLGISAVGLLGFLDEVGFGGRFLGIEFPVLRNEKLDAVHDIVHLGFIYLKSVMRHYPVLGYLFIGLCVLLMVTLIIKYGPRLVSALSSEEQRPVSCIGLIFVTLIASALAFDAGFGIFFSEIFTVLEEVFEMTAALALVMSPFCIYSLQSDATAQKAKFSGDRIAADRIIKSDGLS